MNSVARGIAGVGAFVAIGVAVSLAVALPQRDDANPDPGVSYVWRGMNPSGQFCYPWTTLAGYHPCWHDDEGNPPGVVDYSAIDYSFYWPDNCADEPVWMEYTGNVQLFKIVEYIDHCTGVRARIYQGSYNEANYRGDIHYLHIDPNEYWLDQEVPYQLIYIGDVSAQQDALCPWDAAHLHQSARVSAETPFYTNRFVDPTEDDEWVHAIMWEAATGDQDGDAYTNEAELYMGTDPFDSCPDGSWDDAWPPDNNNSGEVDLPDVLEFKPHFNCSVGQGCYDNRFDLNVDGAVALLDVLMLKPDFNTEC